MSPYLWEEATDKGRSLSDRQPIQQQILEVRRQDVPFIIVMFGERIGVPLQDELPEEWKELIEPWRAGTDGFGLIHPWATNRQDERKLLEAGGFPLTGTVFELVCAHDKALFGDEETLVCGYCANKPIDRVAEPHDILFNGNKIKNRLRETLTDSEEKAVLEREYDPQVRALFNLLKYAAIKQVSLGWCDREENLVEEVSSKARKTLAKRFGFFKGRNPFKSTLEHWKITDDRQLPGRDDLAKKIVAEIKNLQPKPPTLVLVTGPSGCGKSSLLQRGVLRKLKEDGWAVLAIRPTDLEGIGQDRLDTLWELLCTTIPACRATGITRFGREKMMASRLADTLTANNIRFVFALDQFEEIIDDLAYDTKLEQKTSGWWPVIEFLKGMATCPVFRLAGTLESARADAFKALDVTGMLARKSRTFDAEAKGDDVAEIAKTGFASEGITLESDLLEALKGKWDTYMAADTTGNRKISALPLVCLWLSKLFDRFDDRAGEAKGSGLKASMDRAGKSNGLSLEDIGGQDAIAFEDLISDLASTAWKAATGEEIPSGSIVDHKDFLNTLTNFLSPFVAIDDEGQIRLTAGPNKGRDAATSDLRNIFGRKRLLVPAGVAVGNSNNMLRIVHQALLDRWEPARQWRDWRMPYLNTEHDLRLDAKIWNRRGRPKVDAGQERIMDAAQVLQEYRVDWPLKPDDELPAEDVQLRDYALMLFRQATTPRKIIEGSIYDSLFVHVAATYHEVGLLKVFADKDRSCLRAKLVSGGSPMHNAAWTDGPAVAFLLSRSSIVERNIWIGLLRNHFRRTKQTILKAYRRLLRKERQQPGEVETCSAKADWHPIAAAVQVGANENYRLLVQRIADVNEPIGPHGFTMLHIAARYGNCAAIEDLLKHKAKSDVCDDWNETPLMEAARHGQEKAFNILLSTSNLLAKNGNDENALHLAAANGHGSIFDALFKSQVVNPEAVNEALNAKAHRGWTPLMHACWHKKPGPLRRLLIHCDPNDDVHWDESLGSLLHLAVTNLKIEDPTDDEKRRARFTVQTLLDDGRLKVDAKNAAGRTAFEVANAYDDARNLLRQHMKIPYSDLSAAIRRADLATKSVSQLMRVLREAPEILSDRHGDEHGTGSTGLAILIKDKRLKPLALALEERLIADDLFAAEAAALVKLMGEKDTTGFSLALINRSLSSGIASDHGPVFLDHAIRSDDQELIDRLVGNDIRSLRGSNATGLCVFHKLAIQASLDSFRKNAERHRYYIPRDNWGRKPSDLAAERHRSAILAMEDELFAESSLEVPTWH